MACVNCCFTAYSGLSARVPPDHTRIRKLVQGCFGPRRFKAIEPQIRQVVTHALDAIIANGKAEFVREFAYDVPAFVLFRLVGVPVRLPPAGDGVDHAAKRVSGASWPRPCRP